MVQQLKRDYGVKIDTEQARNIGKAMANTQYVDTNQEAIRQVLEQMA